MMIRGDNLSSLTDVNSSLTDVGEVIPGDDLYIGNTTVGNQTGPGI